MTFAIWFLTISCALSFLSAMGIAFMVGLERKPYLPRDVVFSWIFAILYGIVVFILWSNR